VSGVSPAEQGAAARRLAEEARRRTAAIQEAQRRIELARRERERQQGR
jgi:hypothetical protein